MYPAFVLLLVYGLRRGEVLGLSWHDVDLEHGVLRIHQQLLRARGRLQLGPVKTNAGRRDLPLLGVARSVLLQHAELKVLGSASHEWTAHDLVFTTRTGRPVEPRNLARSFHRIIASYGLRPIRLHSLRRTTATLLQLGSWRPAPGHDGDPRPCPDRCHDGDLHRGRRRKPTRGAHQAQRAFRNRPGLTVAVTSAVKWPNGRSDVRRYDSDLVGRTGFEPVTSSVSGWLPSRPSSSLAAVAWPSACCVLFVLPSVSCAYPCDPQRSRAVVGPSLGDVHGSGGRQRDRADFVADLRYVIGCSASSHRPFRKYPDHAVQGSCAGSS